MSDPRNATVWPDLTGRSALVVGVGPGLGSEVVTRLAQSGATTGAVARTGRSLDTLVPSLTAAGHKCHGFVADAGVAADVARLAMEVRMKIGAPEILVYNASVTADRRRVEDAAGDFDAWREYFEVILYGALRLVREFAGDMRRVGRGSVVMINSMESELCMPGMGNYAAAKRALEGVTRVLAGELGPDHIRVNGVHPGWMHGDSVDQHLRTRAAAERRSLRELYAVVEERMALRRMPTPGEVAGTVLYLASDLALPVTGQSIHVNAGQLFH